MTNLWRPLNVGDYENCCLLKCDAVHFGKWLQKFQWILLDSSFALESFYCCEDVGSKFSQEFFLTFFIHLLCLLLLFLCPKRQEISSLIMHLCPS
jgi:hypothetical protein